MSFSRKTKIRIGGAALAFSALFAAFHVYDSYFRDRWSRDEDRRWAVEMMKGGYILYFRHAQRQKWETVMAFDVYEHMTGTNAAEASFKDAVCLTN